MNPLVWTDDRVERLKRLWLEGLSASQVARQLGGVSRSAVIGKLYRLGLLGRGGAAARPKRSARPTSSARGLRTAVRTRSWRAQPAAAYEPLQQEAQETGLVRDLASLGRHQCRWPLGDPQAADFAFCGRQAPGFGPYCLVHHRRAYVSGRTTVRGQTPSCRRQA